MIALERLRGKNLGWNVACGCCYIRTQSGGGVVAHCVHLVFSLCPLFPVVEGVMRKLLYVARSQFVDVSIGGK